MWNFEVYWFDSTGRGEGAEVEYVRQCINRKPTTAQGR